MKLFHKDDPWQDGARATATVERVAVTTEYRAASHSGDDRGEQKLYLTFAFTNAQGQPVYQEDQFWLWPVDIPRPGSIVDVAYTDAHIAFDIHTVRPPDPGVPSGWSGGVFAIENIGSHVVPADDRDRERELFRTGTRAQGQVVSFTNGMWDKFGAVEYTFTLQGGTTTFQAQAWLVQGCMPQAGDVIQVAVSADGTEVALDTDERYTGGPGRALVWTVPPDIAAQRAEKAKSDAVMVDRMAHETEVYRQTGMTSSMLALQQQAGASVASGQLDQQLANVKSARQVMGAGYETMVRMLLDRARASGALDEDAYKQKLADALAD
jgi:hypothetical protein